MHFNSFAVGSSEQQHGNGISSLGSRRKCVSFHFAQSKFTFSVVSVSACFDFKKFSFFFLFLGFLVLFRCRSKRKSLSHSRCSRTRSKSHASQTSLSSPVASFKGSSFFGRNSRGRIDSRKARRVS